MGIFSNFGYKLLSVAIAFLVWFVAQGQSDIEGGFDIPVVLNGVPEDLVVTDVSADAVHVRVAGSRSALRAVDDDALEYSVQVRGAKRGEAMFEVDSTSLEDKLPRGARIVGRSPSTIELSFEQRARREIPVRPDVTGQPAEGFEITGVQTQPDAVEVGGARPEVLRLYEVVTEAVDVTGARQSIEREVRVSPGAGHVWVEGPNKVVVRIVVEPIEQPAAAPEPPPAEESVSQG